MSSVNPLRTGLALRAAAALLVAGCGAAPATTPTSVQPAEVVRIWPGPAPGTESWSGAEVQLDADLPRVGKAHIVTNVTVPTLTVFRPPVGRANGTAMVILPGGAFRALAWDLEATDVAQWLAARGITAFVLKYRVRPPTDNAAANATTFEQSAAATKVARDVAVADAEQAFRTIRANAGKYGIAPHRIGMIGFSAGAIATMSVILTGEPAVRPDFAASIYGAMAIDQPPPVDGPPLFIVAAQDDPQLPSAKSVEIYDRWTRAHLPAELHLYEKGGHGFGMRARYLPVGQWPAAFEAWLRSRGLAGPAH